jgi:hypothetical protein
MFSPLPNALGMALDKPGFYVPFAVTMISMSPMIPMMNCVRNVPNFWEFMKAFSCTSDATIDPHLKRY